LKRRLIAVRQHDVRIADVFGGVKNINRGARVMTSNSVGIFIPSDAFLYRDTSTKIRSPKTVGCRSAFASSEVSERVVGSDANATLTLINKVNDTARMV